MPTVHRLEQLVADIHRDVDADEAMRWVARLVAWDRYQGSADIAEAADYVAEQARRVGLVDVEVLDFPADGRTSWWTYTAPGSWTPRSARLWIGDGPPTLSYPAQPYGLAAGSAAADLPAAPLALAEQPRWPAGAVVLVDSPERLGPGLFARLRDERAKGFCVATHPDRPDQVGRVELPVGGPLFGFSVTPAQLEGLRASEVARMGLVAAAWAGIADRSAEATGLERIRD